MQVASDKRICQMHSKINGKRGILVLCVVVAQIMGPLHYSSVCRAYFRPASIEKPQDAKYSRLYQQKPSLVERAIL